MKKEVLIAGKQFQIEGDDAYVRALGEVFEAELMSIMAAMCDPGSQVLDVGGNVGMTALGFSHACDGGKVVAIEPVPRTFSILQQNTKQAENVVALNFALGKTPGTVTMQGHNDNLSGSFVADAFHIDERNHFSVDVDVKTLDQCFAELGLSRIDFIKIDVEGFELEVLEGAMEVIQRFKPRVVLEMNHWCLNMFRRISIPEFRERLMAIFPHVYALDGEQYLDFTDETKFISISHAHLIEMRFANIVAGFDDEDLKRRMDKAISSFVKPEAAPVISVTDERDLLISELNEKIIQFKGEVLDLHGRLAAVVGEHAAEKRLNQDLLDSTSWKITAPIRAIKKLVS